MYTYTHPNVCNVYVPAGTGEGEGETNSAQRGGQNKSVITHVHVDIMLQALGDFHSYIYM